MGTDMASRHATLLHVQNRHNPRGMGTPIGRASRATAFSGTCQLVFELPVSAATEPCERCIPVLPSVTISTGRSIQGNVVFLSAVAWKRLTGRVGYASLERRRHVPVEANA